ncbi:GNAT family N-acetyltransferase [Emcibacter nanhaiensis]|uniref:GNAT family N-acetyltransferase n=1 Tax=Emcibacter nanhaiensis TaxID=1505037 RepID=A0A501PCL5_9PROT|nr:GNAT family N-acetyltransferase [Emcibacter nanhaiensis]TPD57762.1 GNAT family N-acetyltransferase [Emcibacter nanhaiensis]
MTEIVEIRQLSFGDWAELYRGYADSYGVPITDEQLHKVWEWLGGHETELRGLAAVQDGKPVGIVHYRRFLRPLAGEVGMFLDDIYVAKEARRHGVGEALIDAIKNIAETQNCTMIRWITHEDRPDAMAFYKKFGKETRWVTFDLKLDEREEGYERK